MSGSRRIEKAVGGAQSADTCSAYLKVQDLKALARQLGLTMRNNEWNRARFNQELKSKETPLALLISVGSIKYTFDTLPAIMDAVNELDTPVTVIVAGQLQRYNFWRYFNTETERNHLIDILRNKDKRDELVHGNDTFTSRRADIAEKDWLEFLKKYNTQAVAANRRSLNIIPWDECINKQNETYTKNRERVNTIFKAKEILNENTAELDLTWNNLKHSSEFQTALTQFKTLTELDEFIDIYARTAQDYVKKHEQELLKFISTYSGAHDEVKKLIFSAAYDAALQYQLEEQPCLAGSDMTYLYASSAIPDATVATAKILNKSVNWVIVEVVDPTLKHEKIKKQKKKQAAHAEQKEDAASSSALAPVNTPIPTPIPRNNTADKPKAAPPSSSAASSHGPFGGRRTASLPRLNVVVEDEEPISPVAATSAANTPHSASLQRKSIPNRPAPHTLFGSRHTPPSPRAAFQSFATTYQQLSQLLSSVSQKFRKALLTQQLSREERAELNLMIDSASRLLRVAADDSKEQLTQIPLSELLEALPATLPRNSAGHDARPASAPASEDRDSSEFPANPFLSPSQKQRVH